MGTLTFPVQPFWITLMFEIIFSQLMITFLLDHFLTHLVGILYYRRINSGGRISIKSANIPCFTNFLVGRWFDRINLLALTLRIAIVVVFLRLDADITTTYQTVSTTSTFLFDPNDLRKVNKSEHSATGVARRAQFTKACRHHHDDGRISFHQIAFDLVGGVTFDSEYKDPTKETITEIDDSKLYCLSPDYINNQTYEYVSVNGCSTNTPSCTDNDRVSVNVSKNNIPCRKVAQMGLGDSIVVNTLLCKSKIPKNIQQTWSGVSVSSGNLICVKLVFNIEFKPFISCIATANVTQPDGTEGTLIEFWGSLSPSSPQAFTLVRHFPGPIVSPPINIPDELKSYILTRELWGIWNLNYVEQTALIVSHFLVYKAENLTFQSSQHGNIATQIDLFALLLACVCLVLTGIALIVITVYVRNRNDIRPRFHTIDGLSSILREEDEPSGRSLAMGRTATLGRWKPLNGREAQLGPVRQVTRTGLKGDEISFVHSHSFRDMAFKSEASKLDQQLGVLGVQQQQPLTILIVNPKTQNDTTGP